MNDLIAFWAEYLAWLKANVDQSMKYADPPLPGTYPGAKPSMEGFMDWLHDIKGMGAAPSE